MILSDGDTLILHGLVPRDHKTGRDILRFGDIQAFRLSKLELHNAHLKRTADEGASRTLELRTEGKARQPLKSAEGPAKLVETKGYSTTTILSSLKKCEARQQLRRGTASGESIPASRVAERVFGVGGPGRSKLLSTGIHIENLGSMYDPRMESCLAAFARLLE